MDVSVFPLLLMKKSWKLSMLLRGQIVFGILTTKRVRFSTWNVPHVSFVGAIFCH